MSLLVNKQLWDWDCISWEMSVFCSDPKTDIKKVPWWPAFSRLKKGGIVTYNALRVFVVITVVCFPSEVPGVHQENTRYHFWGRV